MLTDKKRSAIEMVLLTLILLCVFLWTGLHRFIAADEGFYLLAAKYAVLGDTPYVDFFYPQMPGFPYLYGIWMRLFGFTWESARVFGAILSVFIVLLTYSIFLRKCHKTLALLGLLSLLGIGLVIGWFPLAKTYSASTLLLLGAYAFFDNARERQSPLLLLVCSGICVGLAVNIRLFYVVTIPVFLLALLLEKDWKNNRLRTIAAFLLGGALTYLPHLYLMYLDFDSYWFNNVGYHVDRSHRSPEIDILSRIKITKILLGIINDPRADGLQFPTLLYGTVLYVLTSLFSRRYIDLAAWLGLALFAIQLVPDPIHYQYFSTVVPFFLLATFLFISHLFSSKKLPLQIVAALLLAFVLFQNSYYAPRAYKRFTKTGHGVKGITKRNRERYTIAGTRKISQKIEEASAGKGYVLALWPGYVLETQSKILPGLENQFWLRISHKLTPEERQQYHLLDKKEIRKRLHDPETTALVCSVERCSRYFQDIDLQSIGYELVDEIYGERIYRRNQ